MRWAVLVVVVACSHARPATVANAPREAPAPPRCDAPLTPTEELRVRTTQIVEEMDGEARAFRCNLGLVGSVAADELAWIAAACDERAGKLAVAAEGYARLRVLYPNSMRTAEATRRHGYLYLRRGELGDAARVLELYAQRYAGELRARDAIADAAMVRAVLGDETQRREDQRYFDRTYGRKSGPFDAYILGRRRCP